MTRKVNYPIGSISSGTMRPEDLIPCFCRELQELARQTGILDRKRRRAHMKLVKDIERRIDENAPAHAPKDFDRKDPVTQTACAWCGLDIEGMKPYRKGEWRDRGNNTHCPVEEYFESDDPQEDLEALFNALDAYSGPYFYFGAHPGDGADYGWWLSEDWSKNFVLVGTPLQRVDNAPSVDMGIQVDDLANVPKSYRGEVAHVNDHGNITLYRATSRGLREVWSIV